VKERENYLHIK